MSAAPKPRDWDAETYHRVSDPMVALGAEVVERLELRGDETVLDAGCGSGRVTALLLERLPDGRVIAVDGAPSMVALAREALPAERVTVLEADLCELSLPEPADAILSTATFHWIGDHDRLFERLYTALRPGGALEAQCGGAGNVERVLAATVAVQRDPRFERWFAGWEGPWHFATPERTAGRLRSAGFEAVRTSLQARPVRPPDPLHYLESICLGSHLPQLPEELRRPFAQSVLERLREPPVIDYVRLDISARRPG